MTTPLPQKYPLVQKAMDEQAGLLRFLGGAMPPALAEAQDRTLALIEEHVARPAAEKEALMVGAVLGFCPPFIFDDTSRFHTEYSPEVNAVVTEMLGADDGRTLSRNMAQIKTAAGAAMIELTFRHLQEDAETKVTAEMLADARQQSGAEEALVFPNLDAPGLRAAYDAAKTGLLDLMAQKIAADAPAPKPPRKPSSGPKTPKL